MVFNTAAGYTQPDETWTTRPNFVVDFIQSSVRRAANESNEVARAKIKEAFLREEELVSVRKAWRAITQNHDAYFVRWWWQRAAKQTLDRWGMLNEDGSIRPYRTKMTMMKHNPYDHWLGLEPNIKPKINWEVYL